MKFDKIVNEVKELNIGDEVTFPGKHEVWTVDSEDDGYYTLKNPDGLEQKVSRYKIADLKKVPMLEFKTQVDKEKEIERYKIKINNLKAEMKRFKKNAHDGKKYKELEKKLGQYETMLDVAKRKTPRMTIY
jgi:hypothetical protein